MPRCVLKLGDQTVLVAEGQVPEAEYALFDPGDIELAATEPGVIREVGFKTRVADARARLEALGVTGDAAREAADATRPAAARAYARGAAVRQAAGTLGPVELFEGGTFGGDAGYAGAWLDLATLAKDLGVAGASTTIQSLHLAALLAEHDDDEPVTLSTAEITSTRRAGMRTHRRPRIADLDELVRAIGMLRPGARRCEAGPGPQDILGRLAARPRLTPASRERLRSLEAALAGREAPATGPLADPELWAIEVALGHDPRSAVATIDALEHRRGRIPATAYLRARVALLTGSESARATAERTEALSGSMPHFHELQLLSAQAWATAGEPRRAMAFARDLVDNAAAPDSIRMHAQNVLCEANAAPAKPSSERRIRASVDGMPCITASMAAVSVATPRVNSWRPAAAATEATPARGWSVPPPSTTGAEALETLGLPPGAFDAGGEAVTPSDPPRTPVEARIHCTLLTRELGRMLRAEGVEANCDLDGLEITQRHLREALPEAGARAIRADEQRHLLRHGAFLSEVLARRLGARWVDLDSADPQRWAMLVPSASRLEPSRVWPFARVARFAVMAHKERDLVSYYLELEARARTA